MKSRFSALAAAAVLAATSFLVVTPPAAEADHSWGKYHWARTSNEFKLQLGDNLTTTEWKRVLGVASSYTPPLGIPDRRDWNESTVLDTLIITGQDKPCRNGTTGRVEVCNARYGWNGWLGVAQIWASGDHITKATVKVNDTYFNTSTYNQTWWRHFVMCQEVGHTFGLVHQDEVMNNVNRGSCMDYTNDPTGSSAGYGGLNNESPNQHDYDQLVSIYDTGHLGGAVDTTSTVGGSTASTPGRGMSEEAGDGPPDWGRPIRTDNEGRAILYRKDFGGDRHLLTWVRSVHPNDRPGRP